MTWAYSVATASGVASISGTTLTFSATPTGTVATNMAVTGTGILANTVILSGSGLVWTVTRSQTVTARAVSLISNRLTSTGGTEAAPDSLLAGADLVQAADATKAYRNGFNAWLLDIEIRYAGSFILFDNDSNIQIFGNSMTRSVNATGTPGGGGLIHGNRSNFIISTAATRIDLGPGNGPGILAGSTFICRRSNTSDPAPKITLSMTGRYDYPSVLMSQVVLAKVAIDALDICIGGSATSSAQKLYFGGAK
jgi:hypothetical protein